MAAATTAFACRSPGPRRSASARGRDASPARCRFRQWGEPCKARPDERAAFALRNQLRPVRSSGIRVFPRRLNQARTNRIVENISHDDFGCVVVPKNAFVVTLLPQVRHLVLRPEHERGALL